MGISPILDINSKLILPVYLLFCQALVVTNFHSFNQLDRDILVPTALPPIMVPQPPYFLLDLLLMIAMSELEGGGALPHILPPAVLTGSKINDKGGVTIHFLSDGVCFSGVSALEFPPFLQNWAGNPALATF